jgi:DNA polymerase-1
MSEPTAKPLVLIDGSNYLFRAFHALPPLSSPDGQPTGAIHGVLNMVRKLFDSYRPEHCAVVFDAPGKTFRDAIYGEYKANRPPMSDDLRSQIEPLLEIVRAQGLPLLVVPDVEADDVIGTLTRQAVEAGLEVVISTGDKDLAQLVGEHVTLLDTMYDVVTDVQRVGDKFGVPPERIVDYLALVGDTVDNIPGVAKVGPKTAAKWLAEFGSLEGLIEHADEIKGKAGENLRAHLAQLPVNKALATIRCDVPLEFGPRDLTPCEPDRDRLRELYTRFGLGTLMRRLSREAEAESVSEMGDVSGGGEAENAAPAEYHTILDAAEFDSWLSRLEAAELIAFDTETTSLDYMQARIVGVSFAVEAGNAAYLPLAHAYVGAPDQLDRDECLARLQPLLEDPERAKVGHNLKYDMSVLANHGVTLRGVRYDTMLESYVLNSTVTRHDMDSVAFKYLGHQTIHYEDVAGKGAKQLCFDQVPIEQAGPYAAEDAEVTWRLHQALWPRLQAAGRLQGLLESIEIPLVPVLSRIERTGVLVDGALLRAHSARLAKRLAELEKEAHQLAGQPFNLGSPKQLQEILYEKMGLPVKAKTPKGQPSTAEDVLQELAQEFPLPAKILEHRALAKLKSTYTDKLPQQVDEQSGRVHTSYHQAVASTGRLSSTDPNLQNIPVRSEEGRRIRQAFIAPQGHRILAADYSQIELRIMAHLSGDESLLRAFAEGQDIHRATAAEVFGVTAEQVDGEQRRRAKAINFGLIYGMSAFGLARQLSIPREEAHEYVQLYFQRYPGVREFMDRTRVQAREDGYVETVYGRRLYLPEINSRNGARRQAAERTAINAPMQGTAADVIKRAMISVDQWLHTSDVDARMVMQVHDELVLEVADEQVEQVGETLRQRMEAAADLSVALVVEVGVGANWDEAH